MAELSRRIQTAYEWDSLADPVRRGYTPPVERTEVDVPEDILESYVGKYELRPEVSLVVTLEDGALFVEPTDQERLPMFAESETVFFLKAVEAQISFTRDDSGAVTGLILRRGAVERPARRVKWDRPEPATPAPGQ